MFGFAKCLCSARPAAVALASARCIPFAGSDNDFFHAGAVGRRGMSVGGRTHTDGERAAGSARRQPPADDLAGEAERLLRQEPDSVPADEARRVLDFEVTPGGRAAPELYDGASAASRTESDVMRALSDRAQEDEWQQGERGDREDMRSTAAASDPATEFDPWNH